MFLQAPYKIKQFWEHAWSLLAAHTNVVLAPLDNWIILCIGKEWIANLASACDDRGDLIVSKMVQRLCAWCRVSVECHSPVDNNRIAGGSLRGCLDLTTNFGARLTK